jgi:hypothetical protein
MILERFIINVRKNYDVPQLLKKPELDVRKTALFCARRLHSHLTCGPLGVVALPSAGEIAL